MNNGLILSIISGLSTLIGLFFMINFKDRNRVDKLITISLSMAFIVMILISIFDLFVEGLKNLQNKPFLGVLSYVMINYIIIHIIIRLTHKISKNKIEKGNLYFLGIINMIALLIHNIPEGVITCITVNYNLKLGIKIATSIILHNIPEGISIAVPIYYATKSKKRGSICVFLAAIGEPIGALITLFLFKNKINSNLIGYILISVGVLMIYIAVEEIFSQISSKNKKNVLIGLSIGLILFLINLLI